MKRIASCFILIFVAGILLGCAKIGGDATEKILAPKNNRVSIFGTWQVQECKGMGNDTSTLEERKKWIGKKIELNDKGILFNGEYYSTPSYKIKTVKAKEYFLYAHKTNIADLNISNEDIEVLSIAVQDRPFYDFIKIKDDRVIVYTEDAALYLTRVSEDAKELQESNIEKKIKEKKEVVTKEPELLRSGVLLGVRSNVKDVSTEENEKSEYKTIWIAATNKVLHPIIEVPNLFVPRMKGFWKVGVNRQTINGYLQDVIFAKPFDSNSIELNNISNNKGAGNLFRNITFVSNDYVAIEYGSRKMNNTQNEISDSSTAHSIENTGYEKLQVLPIDNIQKVQGVKISDVMGERGKLAFYSSAQSVLASKDKVIADRLESQPREESFNMVRRNGYWIIKGRLNNNKRQMENSFLDFNINIMPSSKLISYDELFLSWSDIKEKVPDAMDAYTSPNKDITIVISKNMIYVYSLKNTQLSEKPIDVIKLSKEETVVMAEWATGEYVEKWEKETEKEGKVIRNE